MGGIRRREFIALLGGGAAWPVVARAQQQERMRHISLLLGIAENDPEARSRVKAFQQGLRDLGWVEGRNIRIDYRFAASDLKPHQGVRCGTNQVDARRDRRQQHACSRRSAAGDKHYSDCFRGGQ